jgi:multisubunit Na+/H+ antiporter MnhG subunit
VSVRHTVASVLLVAGGLLEVLAVLGLCVMRDALDRLHYVGLAGFGALLIGIAILVNESFSLIGDKAVLVGVFLVTTGPVLVHATARSLLTAELGDWRTAIRQPRSADAERPAERAEAGVEQ